MTPWVFSSRVPPLPADDVNAGDADVKAVEVFIVEVKMALRIEDVHLAAHQQPDAVHLAGNDKHIPKVKQSASARNAGPMLRDAQHLQTLVGSCPGHLLQAAVGVSRSHRVGVNI